MEREKLFTKFVPVSPEAWKDKINADLKGADYDKKLVWKTGEGFNAQPFYTQADLEKHSNLDVCPGDFPYLRGKNIKGNPWLIRQDIKVNDIENANETALDIRLKGVDSFGFHFHEDYDPKLEEIEQLLHNIRLDLMELNYDTTHPEKMLSIVEELAVKYNRELEKVKGSLSFDPLGHFSRTGSFLTDRETELNRLSELIKKSEHLPNFHVATVDGSLFHNAGSGIVTQLAFALASGAEYLTYLTEKGIDIDLAAQKLRFRFAVGSNYFMEIAKFRAARYLWANIVNAYGLNDAENASMFIHCVSSEWNKTVYDPYVNMLRVTTETMSSLIGGIDSMTVLPFNAAYEESNDFSERIARNVQLLLKGESYFDKVNDPAAGSYYIEELTANIIEQAWDLFLKIDEMGGYTAAFEKGFISEHIKTEAANRDKQIAQGRRSVLGTNKYPNITESLEKYPTTSKDENTKGLETYRGAMAFEELRYKTDSFTKSNKRPVVWMLTYGNLAMRNARAQFAGNFFGCAGFEIENNIGFNSIEEGIEAAKKAKPDIVVLCSSDPEYDGTAETAIDALKNDCIVVVAGYPKELVEKLTAEGFENFIHVRSNVLEELKRYQQTLNIS